MHKSSIRRVCKVFRTTLALAISALALSIAVSATEFDGRDIDTTVEPIGVAYPSMNEVEDYRFVSSMGRVTGRSVRLREEPSLNSNVILTFDKGTVVGVLGEQEDWLYVTYAGESGFISKSYIEEISNTGLNLFGMVDASATNSSALVYQEPSEDSVILNTINDGAVVNIFALYEGFYGVKCEYGTQGYIRTDVVCISNNLNSYSQKVTFNLATSVTKVLSGLINHTTNGTGDGDKIVNIARSCIGIPYKYGGTSRRAFDCSGFTQYVYQKAGYSIPRTASTQYASGSGTIIYSKSKLSVGDLVFFRDPKIARGKACSHVGIYIGNGQVIHCSSSKGVTTGSIYSGYLSTYYKCGKHIV